MISGNSVNGPSFCSQGLAQSELLICKDRAAFSPSVRAYDPCSRPRCRVCHREGIKDVPFSGVERALGPVGTRHRGSSRNPGERFLEGEKHWSPPREVGQEDRRNFYCAPTKPQTRNL